MHYSFCGPTLQSVPLFPVHMFFLIPAKAVFLFKMFPVYSNPEAQLSAGFYSICGGSRHLMVVQSLALFHVDWYLKKQTPG